MKIDFTFWLIMCLSASIIVNFLAFWYIRRVLARLLFLDENLSDLGDLIKTYQNHLTSIFSLEQYYGDEDIKFMLEHTKSLREVLNQYNEASKIIESNEEEVPEEQEEEEEYAAPSIDEENVFYAGTRASNN